MNLKKVSLAKLPDGNLQITPIEEIIGLQTVTSDEKTRFVIHEKTIPGGASDFLGDHNQTRDITDNDIEKIIASNNECFTEVNHEGSLSMPSNALGYKLVVLHFVEPLLVLPKSMMIRRRSATALIGTGNYCTECGGLCGNSNHDSKKW